MIEKIKETFIKDSIKDLEAIENLVKDVKGVLEDCVIEKVFATAHNIKGTAPMLGINSVDHMVKPIELVFSGLRSGSILSSKEIVSNTQKLIPVIKSELQSNQQHRVESNEVDESLRFFDSLITKNA
ncbi:Hpt domain-containing protein [Plebeiibacterium marinum]|uniref:Hpt domain-containing protein n=1 Tax=Plebeiibacterium marinum TaxID=2992111 RepID=A0AAE3MER8_9BACT|nr:Hpt domain-containing protein [Plebeiobacterium marinum]MCW3806411.1 Hpt domain-containing protein [Plebeiobacterium marinum]